MNATTAFARSTILLCVASSVALAQAPGAPAAGPPRAPSCLTTGFGTAAFQSTEVLPDGRVTFRVCAPEATSATVTSSDIGPALASGRGGGPAFTMTKDTLGLWTGTTPIAVIPGTYRYNFRVNGARVPDPGATRFSHERSGTNSVLEVPGPAGAFQVYDKAIPHGAVSSFEYWSNSLGIKRRAHVYTPPGYMKNSTRYPVLYLVHGAGDSDDSWTSIGHANYILDNLIAAGKAKPMIVVMPFGHTPARPAGAAPGGGGANLLNNDDFGEDLAKDLIPYVEANYRTLNRTATRAMAGLSMGGAHTIRFGITHPERFGYIGVFSMGLMDTTAVKAYETTNAKALDRGAKEFKLVYYAIGKDDFLYRTVAPTREVLDRHGIQYVYNESGGGHTWMNWRDYLADFAPRLFR